jgi:hypothetical protein
MTVLLLSMSEIETENFATIWAEAFTIGGVNGCYMGREYGRMEFASLRHLVESSHCTRELTWQPWERMNEHGQRDSSCVLVHESKQNLH